MVELREKGKGVFCEGSDGMGIFSMGSSFSDFDGEFLYDVYLFFFLVGINCVCVCNRCFSYLVSFGRSFCELNVRWYYWE